MNNPLINSASERQRNHKRSYQQRSARRGRNQTEEGFLCKHCNNTVSTAWFLSGVQNRNHCPYCLWSRHLDLYAAGDRLSACKAPMRPVGLTVKAAGKKYGPGHGELMLIHLCMECERLSINRIAADDIPGNVLSVFEDSFELDMQFRSRLEAEGITVLTSIDHEDVHSQLFGREPDQVDDLFSTGTVSLVMQDG
jgi:hypothetical protein